MTVYIAREEDREYGTRILYAGRDVDKARQRALHRFNKYHEHDDTKETNPLWETRGKKEVIVNDEGDVIWVVEETELED